MVKKVLINSFFAIFSIGSSALIVFVCYVIFRKMTAPPYAVSLIVHTLNWFIGVSLTLGIAGLVAAILVRKPFLNKNLLAMLVAVLMVLGSLFVLWYGYDLIRDVEGVYFRKSPYRRMFLYVAWPMLVGNVLLLAGWIWPAKKESKAEGNAGA